MCSQGGEALEGEPTSIPVLILISLLLSDLLPSLPTPKFPLTSLLTLVPFVLFPSPLLPWPGGFILKTWLSLFLGGVLLSSSKIPHSVSYQSCRNDKALPPKEWGPWRAVPWHLGGKAVGGWDSAQRPWVWLCFWDSRCHQPRSSEDSTFCSCVVVVFLYLRSKQPVAFCAQIFPWSLSLIHVSNYIWSLAWVLSATWKESSGKTRSQHWPEFPLDSPCVGGSHHRPDPSLCPCWAGWRAGQGNGAGEMESSLLMQTWALVSETDPLFFYLKSS